MNRTMVSRLGLVFQWEGLESVGSGCFRLLAVGFVGLDGGFGFLVLRLRFAGIAFRGVVSLCRGC